MNSSLEFWTTQDIDDIPSGTHIGDARIEGGQVTGWASMDCCTFELTVPLAICTSKDPLGWIQGMFKKD